MIHRAVIENELFSHLQSEKWLTLAEHATILRLHPVTLQVLAAAGEITAFKRGRAWRCAEVVERTTATQHTTYGRQPVIELLTAQRRSSRCISPPRATAPTSVLSNDALLPEGLRPTLQRRAGHEDPRAQRSGSVPALSPRGTAPTHPRGRRPRCQGWPRLGISRRRSC